MESPVGWVRKTAKTISVIFHPVFIPLYGLIVIYSTPTLLSYMPLQMKKVMLIMVTAICVILPLSLTALLYSLGALKTINARERSERNTLLTFTLIMYSITAYFMMRFPVASLFKAYFLSISIVTLVTIIVNSFFRISLHAVGAGGLLALTVSLILIFSVVSVPFIIAVIVITGAVLSSRLYLGEHKPAEVWSGLVTGLTVTGLVLFILLG